MLGQTTVSFTAMDPHAPSQYIEQWSTSVEKSLGQQTTLEIGYLGSHGVHSAARAPDQQRASGTGSDRAAASFPKISFVPGSVLPTGVTYTPPATGCPTDHDLLPGQHHQPAGEHGAKLV